MKLKIYIPSVHFFRPTADRSIFLMKDGRFNYFSLTKKAFPLLDDKGKNAGTSLQMLCECTFYSLRSSALRQLSEGYEPSYRFFHRFQAMCVNSNYP